jgi:peptidoglycan-N-acetylglucosamine deacetylase
MNSDAYRICRRNTHPVAQEEGSTVEMKIVQCWDDGVLDDIRLIEILRRHDAKASFNLNYGNQPAHRAASWMFRDVKEVWKLGKDELRDVYDGFTIANHSDKHLKLPEVPISEAIEDIRVGRDALEQHFGCSVTGFAYPCGLHSADVENAVREAGHIYARTTKNVDCVFPPDEPMAFHANCHFAAADFWDRFDRAQAEAHPVFYFWGHSYEMITEQDWAEMERKIVRLTAEPDCTWCDLPELFA